MQSITVTPAKKFSGCVVVPGDKSISHRAAILGSLCDGIVDVKGFLCSEDCLNTLRAMQSMGVRVEGFGNTDIKIHGVGFHGLKKTDEAIDVGNSGTGARLLSGLVSGFPFTTVITGDDSIKKRPMKRIAEPLSKMGAKIEGNNCPLKITGGNLTAIDYISPVSSAQVKSCVLIAGLFADGRTSVTETAKSRDHTEKMLEYLGADIKVDGLKVTIKGGSVLKAKPILIPADISSAFFLIAGALIIPGGDVTVKNVGINPIRAEILKVLKRMGADIEIKENTSAQNEPTADIGAKYSRLKGVTVGEDEIPGLIDELPMLATLACFSEGKTVVSGAKELRVKESDRIKTVAENLKKIGADITEKEDGWIINGGHPLKGAVVESYGDHRIAMSLIIAGLAIKGETTVNDTEWINTSFPGFMDLVEKLRK